MNPLIIEPTEFTPKVILDPTQNIFEFSGESRPENTSKFYNPILKWFEQYQSVLYWEKDKYGQQGPPRVFTFRLEYFNSTSAKFIMDILIMLDKMAQDGCNVQVKWHFDPRDEDMKESGEEFAKLLKKLPIEFIEAA